MRVILTEKQKNLIETLILQEIRDTSQYAAKEGNVMKKLDSMFDYFPVEVESDPFSKKEWFIWTLKNGMPYMKIHKDRMFQKMQKEWANICDESDKRDQMLKDIQQAWLNKKQKENKNKTFN